MENNTGAPTEVRWRDGSSVQCVLLPSPWAGHLFFVCLFFCLPQKLFRVRRNCVLTHEGLTISHNLSGFQFIFICHLKTPWMSARVRCTYSIRATLGWQTRREAASRGERCDETVLKTPESCTFLRERASRQIRAVSDKMPRSPGQVRDGAFCHLELGYIIMTQRGLWMMVMMEESAIGRWHRELEAARCRCS